MTYTDIVLTYLEGKRLTPETATPQQLSDAKAYEACYNWYISRQKVQPSVAELAAHTFIQKYALHDASGFCMEDNPEAMWIRIADVLAGEEVKTNPNNKDRAYWFNEFASILVDFKYSPQGSGLYSLGNDVVKASASNCFVVPSPSDSLESIFDTAKFMARIYAARGGVGVDISDLRPFGATTNNAAKSSTGAASFMDFYSHVTSTIGQCIEENQKVLTLRGNVPIKDVVAGDSVWTRKGWIKNLKTLDNDIKPVFKLTTTRGFEIQATANHIFLSGNNTEKKLGDFTIGDSIITMPGTPVNDLPYVKLNTTIDYDKGHGATNNGNRLNNVSLPEELTEKLAYFIGYSFGDGYVERDSFKEPVRLDLACSQEHPEIETKLSNIATDLFAYSPHSSQGDGLVNKVSIHSKLLGLYLEQNGLLKQKHNALVMPEVIWKSRTSVQMAFISGYFDADGYASGSKKGYVIGSVCLPMLKDIQQMLMSAGIVSRIFTEFRAGKEKTETWKDLHSLSITGAYSQKAAIKLLSDSVKISNKAFIAKRDNLLTPFTAKDCSVKYNNYSFVPGNMQKMSAKCYSTLLEQDVVKDNMTILDTVASIEYVGDRPVFDLQLESEHLYVSAGLIVHNCGRRGALMLSIRVDHPDIFRFIEMKRDLDKQWFFNELSDYGIDINDWKYSAIADRLKSTSHANVSVRLNDKFIKAVENDEQFELYFDFADNKYPRISQFVRARDIWDTLIEGATEAAEPGMLNWDKITSESPADCYSEPTAYVMPDGSTITYSFKTLSTNPCITSDGYVKTAEGYKQVKDLLESPWTAIVNGLEYQATPFWKTGDKEVFSIACENGSIIKATKDHTFLCSDNIWRKVSDLLGHTIKQNKVSTAKIDFDSTDFKQGWLIGSIVGDGFYTTASGSALMYWGTEAESLAAFACSCLDRDYSNKERNKVTVKTSSFNSTISKYIEPNTKELKPLIYAQSDSFISGFLSGLIDADGSVQGTQKKGYSLRISQSNVSLLEHCQRLLFTLGINSRIYRNRRPETTKYWKQGNKNYTSKAQHELVITSNNLVLANSCLSLKSSSKHQLLESIVETTSFYNTQPQFKVSSVKSIGIMPVYDCTVDTVHCFDLNGAIAHNCGELPLSAGDSCCLGTHNLPSFVRNPYTPNAKFDWMEFKRVVFLSTRAQDNIKNIDIDLVPLEINRQSAILGRRIGLGCTGLSDALAMLGLRYDSPKALAMTEKIYSVLRDTAYASSIELASEKGAFLAYTPEKEVNNPFLSRLPENLQNKPRRNIALLTNAPNGSMAIIMNNGSSGIEPCFKKEYLRNVKVPGTNDFRQFQVYHQPIADCIAAGGDPSVFIEANDVSGEMRIKLQATIQKYIDHSISVTTNLPAGTTKERVSELYLQAFKEGCKGFTVYVDGCRTGVLTSIKEPVKIHKTLERPKTTNIDIHKVKYKDKQWAVLVGRADNGPLEVFAGIEEETPLPNKYHRAELTKKSRGHYSLTVFLSEDEDDLIKISNIGARFPSPEGMTLTRFISLSLKHGVPVSDICEQLTKSSNSMFDYPAVLNRVLKNYVSEDEYAKKNGEKKCPDCGGALTFRKVDGCMVEICGNCNYTNSKCG